MNQIRYTHLALVLLVLSLTVTAHATDTGATVAGCCSSTSSIATPMGVNLAAQQAISEVNAFTAAESMIINNNIRDTGKAITAEIKKNRKTTTKLFENQNSTLHSFLTQFGSAQAELKNQDRVGKFARFDNLCVGPEIGAGVQIGKKAEKKLAAKLETDSKTYNNFWKNPSKLLEYHAGKNAEKINADVLFPANKTLHPDNLKYAQDITELIINPLPEVQLPDTGKDKTAGKKRDVLQKQKKALLAIPQLVFNRFLAAISPTLPLGNTATKLHQQMGNTGTPEEVIDGKISPYAFLTLASDSRFANPNWYAELAEKNTKALLSESLAMDAARLEIQNRMLELTQLQTLMAAQQNAMDTQEVMNTTLYNLYVNAIKK